MVLIINLTFTSRKKVGFGIIFFSVYLKIYILYNKYLHCETIMLHIRYSLKNNRSCIVHSLLIDTTIFIFAISFHIKVETKINLRPNNSHKSFLHWAHQLIILEQFYICLPCIECKARDLRVYLVTDYLFIYLFISWKLSYMYSLKCLDISVS